MPLNVQDLLVSRFRSSVDRLVSSHPERKEDCEILVMCWLAIASVIHEVPDQAHLAKADALELVQLATERHKDLPIRFGRFLRSLTKRKDPFNTWPDPDGEILRDAFDVIGEIGQMPDAYGSLRLLVDDIFYQSLGSSVINREHEEAIGALTRALLLPGRPVTEFFGSSGESILLSGANIGDVYQAQISETVLAVRLLAHGVSVFFRKPPSERDRFSANFGHVVIDFPGQPRLTHEMLEGAAEGEFNSSLAVLEALLPADSLAKIDLGVVVVSAKDTTSLGTARQMRQTLVADGRLIAAIDLLPTSSSAASLTAWIIGPSKSSIAGVLFVDGQEVSKLLRQSSPKEVAAFCGQVVRQWRFGSRPRSVGDERGELAAIFQRLFKGGYVDVQRVCRIVDHIEIRTRRWWLRAEHYVIEPRVAVDASSVLGAGPILEALKATEPLCIYVIGDNGEGKSRMLASLIDPLGKRGLKTVGLAFGLHDRFRSHIDEKAFVYAGARNSSLGIRVEPARRALSKQLSSLHRRQELLDTFNEVVALLGFESRRFLVPRSALKHGVVRTAELIGVKEMVKNAEENARLIGDINEAEHDWTFTRTSAPKLAIPLMELSSGEQQVLTLAIKLIMHAGPKRVVLVDEPELSLHVSWQRALPKVFSVISQRTGASLVIATHAPVLIASAHGSSDRCFAARNYVLDSIPPESVRSVELTLFDAFRTYTANSHEVHERCARLVANVIRDVNSGEEMDAEWLIPIRKELDVMQLRVEASPDTDDHLARQADLALIARTRELIEEAGTVEDMASL